MNNLLKTNNPVTMYYEIRISEFEKENFITKIDSLIETLKNMDGYLNISLKQMIGESTMAKNYPESLKGVLSSGYLNNSKVPLFYSLFIRFRDISSLNKPNIQSWFDTEIKPLLSIYDSKVTAVTKTSMQFEYYRNIFTTVAAGDRERIFSTAEELCDFFKNKPFEKENSYITVSNHVAIENKNIDIFNTETKKLLNIAQNTFRPALGDDDYNPDFKNGKPGSMDNHYYHNAITTEILQSITDESLCSYLFHGVWESVYDHENSHLDKRFLEAITPIIAHVVTGPVEPFYKTIR